MSRGFDLIRRHLVGRKAGEQEPLSSPQRPAVAMEAISREHVGSDPDSDLTRGPAGAPPPFESIRVATTPPPPKSPRPWRMPRKSNANPSAQTATVPSPTLRGTRLPQVLRPRVDTGHGGTSATSTDAKTPSPSAEAVAIGKTMSGPRPTASAETSAIDTRRPPAAAPLPRQNDLPNAAPSPGDSQLARGNAPDQVRLDRPARHGRVDQPDAATLSPARTGPSRTRRIDKTNARAARRHSVFVALMKGLLPGLTLGLAAVFFFYSYDFQPIELPGNIKFDPGKVSVSTEGIRMVAPKLNGVDGKQQTFEIKAEEAIQDRADPAKVTLVGIDARINLADGGTIGFSAQKGVYNSDLNQIWLSEELEVRSSEGYVAQLSEAQVDFKNGLMVSNSPVLIFTNDGVINASGIQVLDGGKKVIFSGRVTLNLNGSAGETQ